MGWSEREASTILEVPKPVQNTAKAQANGAAKSDLKGGIFRLNRTITFNRLGLYVSAFSAPATGRAAIYQPPNGVWDGNPLPLIATFTVAPSAGLQRLDIAPDAGGVVRLARGLFWLFWGQDSGAGSFSLDTWDTQNIRLMNQLSSLSNGEPPSQFVSSVPASAITPTLNPVVGGDVSTASSSSLLMHRLRTV